MRKSFLASQGLDMFHTLAAIRAWRRDLNVESVETSAVGCTRYTDNRSWRACYSPDSPWNLHDHRFKHSQKSAHGLFELVVFHDMTNTPI